MVKSTYNKKVDRLTKRREKHWVRRIRRQLRKKKFSGNPVFKFKKSFENFGCQTIFDPKFGLHIILQLRNLEIEEHSSFLNYSRNILFNSSFLLILMGDD